MKYKINIKEIAKWELEFFKEAVKTWSEELFKEEDYIKERSERRFKKLFKQLGKITGNELEKFLNKKFKMLQIKQVFEKLEKEIFNV